MFVACNTICFANQTLEQSLRQIRELEFSKVELSASESGDQLKPSSVVRNVDFYVQKIRNGPGLIPAVLDLDFGSDVTGEVLSERFTAMCRFAKSLTIAVLVLPAAPTQTPLEQEIDRLRPLVSIANAEGLVLTIPTDSATIAGDPQAAQALCQVLPGLNLTLDPSHFVHGPHRKTNLEKLFPWVEHVRLRDTGPSPEAFQVRIGQGRIEYGRLATQLDRHGYKRALSVSIDDRLPHDFSVEVEVRKLRLLLESLI